MILKLFLICVIQLEASCDFKTNHTSKVNLDHNTSENSERLINRDHEFKRWLIDTLYELNNSNQNIVNKSKGIKKEITVSPDSLGLSIIDKYDSIVASNEDFKQKDVRDLIMLFREYEEFPKGNFILSFQTDYFYTPSMVPKLPYDMTFNIDNIKIIEQGEVISYYSYIRGRLSYKEVMQFTPDGRKKNERINFIWDGKKLIKRKLE